MPLDPVSLEKNQAPGKLQTIVRSIRFVGTYFWRLSWDCRFLLGVLLLCYVGISKVCGNKVRRSILIGCWKKAAITADFKNFSVCPILNWMDVSRNLDLHQIFVFAGLDDKTAGLLEDCVLSVMRTWSLKLQRGCKMLSFEFSRLAGVSNSKGFSVSQVLAMRLGPNGRQNGSFERIKLA